MFFSLPAALTSLFWSLFGLLELSELDNCTIAEETVGRWMLGIWLVQATIVLLNMLIALVTNKFDEVQVSQMLLVRISVPRCVP